MSLYQQYRHDGYYRLLGRALVLEACERTRENPEKLALNTV